MEFVICTLFSTAPNLHIFSRFMKSALKVLLLFLLLLVAMAGLSIYWTFFKLTPSLDRDISLEGLRSDVTVNWDHYQVPAIEADHEVDVMMVMGYLHARDRLWQMTKKQYKLEGLHSREIDESLIDLDRFYLTLSFGDIARESFDNLPDEIKQLLEAYAAGVNRFMEDNRKHLPVEFTISGARPVEWKPWHAVGVQLLWAWQQQQSFWSKLAFHAIHEHNHEELTRILTGLEVPHSDLFGTADTLQPDPSAYRNLLNDYLDFTQSVYPGRAGYSGTGFAYSTQSPNALSVVNTTVESPLTLPDQGYEVVIHSGGRIRSGITIPGFPAIIHGQNESLAWSIHPLPVDDGDFISGNIFLSDVSVPVDWKRDAGIYDYLSGEVAFDRHFLSLKDGSEHQLILRKADERPIVAVSQNDNLYLAYDWPGFHPSSDIGAYMGIPTAWNAGELEQYVSEIQTPSVQVLYATADGRAGRVTGGMTLSRPNPLKIRDQSEIPDHLSAESLFPGEISENGDPVFLLEQHPEMIPSEQYTSVFYAPWSRSQRFIDFFDQTPSDRLATEIVEIWNNDTYSPFAARLTPPILQALERTHTDSLAVLILEYLQNWNYEFRSNETAATLFEVFLVKSSEKLYSPFMSDTEMQMLLTTPHVPFSAVQNLLLEPDTWPEEHPLAFDEWISESMNDVTGYLIEHYAEEPYAWQWGRVADGAFEATLFDVSHEQSRVARLAERNLFKSGNVSISGSPHTIQSSHIHIGLSPALDAATTSKRTMFVRPDPIAYSVFSSGQTANIFSDHYNDQFQLWNNGETKQYRLNSEAPTGSTQHFHP